MNAISQEKRQSYSEVYEFINLLDCEYINKIPQKLMLFFEREKDDKYTKNINPYEDIKSQKLKKDTIIILSMLNFKYWANDENKQRLNNLYNYNEEKYQKELREKYNPDKIFEKKQELKQEVFTEPKEESLIVSEKHSFFGKIIGFIRRIIGV